MSIYVDNSKFPVADRNSQFYPVEPSLGPDSDWARENPVRGSVLDNLNHQLWSDAQRAHALTCTRVHTGLYRCTRLDVPDNLKVKSASHFHKNCPECVKGI